MNYQVKGNAITVAETLHDAGVSVVLLHGCNCLNVMGAGIALQLKNKWPEVYAADTRFSFAHEFPLDKLGDYTVAKVDTNLFVANLYTQHGVGWDQFSPKALQRALHSFTAFADKSYTIIYPAIGAGLAGGDWNKLYPIFLHELRDLDHIYVEYSG